MAELEAGLSRREFAEWLAFNRLEAIGETRADLRNGILAAALVNIQLGKGAKGVGPLDFMPFADLDERQAPPLPPSQQVRQVFAAIGYRDRRDPTARKKHR